MKFWLHNQQPLLVHILIMEGTILPELFKNSIKVFSYFVTKAIYYSFESKNFRDFS